jgi:hypothetical protein
MVFVLSFACAFRSGRCQRFRKFKVGYEFLVLRLFRAFVGQTQQVGRMHGNQASDTQKFGLASA